jgi:hypothetical protein
MIKLFLRFLFFTWSSNPSRNKPINITKINGAIAEKGAKGDIISIL